MLGSILLLARATLWLGLGLLCAHGLGGSMADEQFPPPPPPPPPQCVYPRAYGSLESLNQNLGNLERSYFPVDNAEICMIRRFCSGRRPGVYCLQSTMNHHNNRSYGPPPRPDCESTVMLQCPLGLVSVCRAGRVCRNLLGGAGLSLNESFPYQNLSAICVPIRPPTQRSRPGEGNDNIDNDGFNERGEFDPDDFLARFQRPVQLCPLPFRVPRVTRTLVCRVTRTIPIITVTPTVTVTNGTITTPTSTSTTSTTTRRRITTTVFVTVVSTLSPTPTPTSTSTSTSTSITSTTSTTSTSSTSSTSTSTTSTTPITTSTATPTLTATTFDAGTVLLNGLLFINGIEQTTDNGGLTATTLGPSTVIVDGTVSVSGTPATTISATLLDDTGAMVVDGTISMDGTVATDGVDGFATIVLDSTTFVDGVVASPTPTSTSTSTTSTTSTTPTTTSTTSTTTSSTPTSTSTTTTSTTSTTSTSTTSTTVTTVEGPGIFLSFPLTHR